MGRPRIRTRIIGSEAVVAGIRLMAPAVQAEVREVTKASLIRIKREARTNVPYSGGKKPNKLRHVRDTIKEKIDKDGLGGKVSAGGKGAMHANIIESGATAHEIKVKTGRVLSDNNRVFGRTVKHPGHAAHPFMKPALAREAPNYRRGVEQAVQRGIAR